MHVYSILCCLVVIGVAGVHVSAADKSQELSPHQIERKALGDRADTRGLRFKDTATIVQSRSLLAPRPDLGLPKGVQIAKTAPKIEFAVIPLEPRYFSNPLRPDRDKGEGLWTDWGQGTIDPITGKLYGAVGNHIFYDAMLHITEYDPGTKRIQTFPEINKALGQNADKTGDGKIHGYLDFLNDNELIFLSYWTIYPEPTPADFAAGYDGSPLMTFNIRTHKIKSLGIPFKRTSFPYHRYDRKRGLMFAVGGLNEFMCYDVRHKRTLWAGYAPPGMKWHDRSMMLDEDTGCVYSSNMSADDPEVHMIKYDPSTNQFTKMKSSVPKNTETGKIDQMRANTFKKAKDGSFTCVTRFGEMFKFFPDEDRIEDLGLCYPMPAERLYTTSLAMTSDERFIYYIPAAHGSSHLISSPIVQYDTVNKTKKVLAFLFPTFYKDFGYVTGGTFSMNINRSGDMLYIIMNGAFTELDNKESDIFGDPSVLVVHIPESERK